MKFLIATIAALATVARAQAPSFDAISEVLDGDKCVERYEACKEDQDCARVLADYHEAANRCVLEKCKLEGLSGVEYAKTLQNCDFECAVNPDNFTIPSGTDLQHSCLETESKGRRADEDVELQYKYESKQQNGLMVPKGCHIVDKAFASQQLSLEAAKKLNEAVCDVSNENKTVCAEIKKSKIRPCSSAASVSATLAFGVAAVLALN
ncbi:MAG: hypothetical protein MHM6MM_009003 [Cercozoa sp. M6MM]